MTWRGGSLVLKDGFRGRDTGWVPWRYSCLRHSVPPWQSPRHCIWLARFFRDELAVAPDGSYTRPSDGTAPLVRRSWHAETTHPKATDAQDVAAYAGGRPACAHPSQGSVRSRCRASSGNRPTPRHHQAPRRTPRHHGVSNGSSPEQRGQIARTLQRSYGNRYLQRLIQRQNGTGVATSDAPIVTPDRPGSIRRFVDKNTLEETVAGWDSAVEKTLMAGVLGTASADAAVAKVYANMFTYAKANWTYKASHGSGNGTGLIAGGSDVGMCETYRNAFKIVLEKLKALTADYAAFQDGFEIADGQALVSTKFVTNENLALLGNAQGYNVDQELDAGTGATKAATRYLFSSHWQLIVNGKTYDPLFQSVNVNNAAWNIDKLSDTYYQAQSEEVAFVNNPAAGPTDGGEFAGRYVMVRNLAALENSVKEADEVKDAHTALTETRDAIAAIKATRNTKRTNYFGKASWRKGIQTADAPALVAVLEKLRDDAQDAVDAGAPDTVLGKMVQQASIPILTEAKYQAGIASRKLTALIAVTTISDMGTPLDEATEALVAALAQPIMKDIA